MEMVAMETKGRNVQSQCPKKTTLEMTFPDLWGLPINESFLNWVRLLVYERSFICYQDLTLAKVTIIKNKVKKSKLCLKWAIYLHTVRHIYTK